MLWFAERLILGCKCAPFGPGFHPSHIKGKGSGAEWLLFLGLLRFHT